MLVKRLSSEVVDPDLEIQIYERDPFKGAAVSEAAGQCAVYPDVDGVASETAAAQAGSLME